MPQFGSGVLAAKSIAFSVPFPTPLPLTQTCSQPWVGLEIPEYLRGFSNSPGGRDPGILGENGLSGAGSLQSWRLERFSSQI
jgi:hypothetical protein